MAEEDEVPAKPKTSVRVKFSGTALVYRDSLTTRGTVALVPERFMEKVPVDVISMWLDGKTHPKVGILGPPPAWLEHLLAPYTGKRSKAWLQTEPWNREKPGPGGTKVLDLAHAGEFWDWVDGNLSQFGDVGDLALLGSDYAALGDSSLLSEIRGPPNYELGMPISPPPTTDSISPTAPGSIAWVASKTSSSAFDASCDESFFYQRLLSSIVLPEQNSNSAAAGADQHFIPASQLRVQGVALGNRSDLGQRKRTLIEMGSAGILRETDGGGKWLALEAEVARSDGGSDICRQIRNDVQLLKRLEQATNATIAQLRKRVERNEPLVVPSRDDKGAESRVQQWQKFQKKKFQILQKKFEEKLGIADGE